MYVVCLNGSESVQYFYRFYSYLYWRWTSNYQEGKGFGSIFTDLTPPHVSAFLKTGHWFATSYVLVFFVYNGLR